MSEELDTQDEALEVEPPEVSMEDTIRQTLSDTESRNAPEETEEQRADRLRDDKGRFAKQEAAPEAAQEAALEAPAESAEVAAPVTVPPELQRLGLRKEEAEAIAANPVAMQAFMRRSEEMHRGLEQYRQKAQFGDEVAQAISPYMATIQSLGVTPGVAIQKLMGADHALRYGAPQQKYQMLSQIAQDYGIDLGQAQEFSASHQQYQPDPQVQHLQSELHQMRSWIEQQNQAREWNERETLNSEIERFKSDPANAYFEQVRNEMAGLLQAGLAADLKDAYEKAIYANPTVRAELLAKQQAAADEQRRAESAQKAQAAKKASAVNIPRRGIVPAAKPVGSMDDTIREAAQRLGIM